jgi:hypothetical protein
MLESGSIRRLREPENAGSNPAIQTLGPACRASPMSVWRAKEASTQVPPGRRDLPTEGRANIGDGSRLENGRAAMP